MGQSSPLIVIPIKDPATATLTKAQQALRDFIQSIGSSSDEGESGGHRVRKGEERKKDGGPRESTAGETRRETRRETTRATRSGQPRSDVRDGHEGLR